ncbi:MAG: asparagine synthetase B, partial [Balneolaceae bacterium]
DIDIEVDPERLSESLDYFTLFDFSAKWDPVPAMLTQNHVSSIKGFYGQTTAFQKDKVKNHVVILGESPGRDQVKYLHGNYGQGTFTFFGGHDPEDYTHRVNDPPTDLSLHTNSPGYRLILNNILFPAAQEQKLET